ncbi:MAG: peptide deformylase [Butyricicoccus sp.]
MVKPIVHDIFFLRQKSEPATKEDTQVITDLIDTLNAHVDNCAGLAANMIGVKKQIIVFRAGPDVQVMLNPVIVKQSDPFETEEECLSLDGSRPTTRYRTIEVQYLDRKFRPQDKIFHGWVAEIIQHEIDHCNGVII